MPDERTYGFQKDDAEALIQGIANGENWFPEIRPRGGKGGGEFMWFEIVEVLCPGRDYVDEITIVVTPTDYSGGCTKTPPGANYDGTYNFYLKCGLDGQVAEQLPGTFGNGHYVYPWRQYDCEPRWIVNLLCHLPECL
jgi:hypothetical protein